MSGTCDPNFTIDSLAVHELWESKLRSLWSGNGLLVSGHYDFIAKVNVYTAFIIVSNLSETRWVCKMRCWLTGITVVKSNIRLKPGRLRWEATETATAGIYRINGSKKLSLKQPKICGDRYDILTMEYCWFHNWFPTLQVTGTREVFVSLFLLYNFTLRTCVVVWTYRRVCWSPRVR